MFEKASRLKLRFNTAQGMVTVEDLWDIPLTSNSNRANLDDIAKGIFKQLKEELTESFVVKTQKTNEGLTLAFNIVKHIIDIRLVENETAALQAANKEKKQHLLSLIAQKENAVLSDKSLDELREMVNNL